MTHTREQPLASPPNDPHTRDATGDAWNNEDERLLSREKCAEVIHKIFQMAKGGGNTDIGLSTWWNGELRWARGEITALSDRKDIHLSIDRRIRGASGGVYTNQIDDVSLAAAVQASEDRAYSWAGHSPDDLYLDPPAQPVPKTLTWSDATFAATTDSRSQLAQTLIAGATEKGMFSAGYLEIRGGNTIRIVVTNEQRAKMKTPKDVSDWMQYCLYTQAQCSMTVRHPKGTGSGWAGASSFDWAQVNPTGLAERALDKCLQSMNPVRIEPGRYTVILEPQALSDLLDLLMWREPGQTPMSRVYAENGRGPFVSTHDMALDLVRSRIGLRVADPRVTISHDPLDQQLGTIPEPGLAPATWIKNGVLQALHYERDYAMVQLNENNPMLHRPSYRMAGGTTTMNEMIESTKRGLIVTRFSGLTVLDEASLLATGVTRDGLWLVEGGKITKAVNNMRITESPLFVLNSIDQLGVPVPVFRPVKNPFDPSISPAIVPPIKANDFSFTATVDAI